MGATWVCTVGHCRWAPPFQPEEARTGLRHPARVAPTQLPVSLRKCIPRRPVLLWFSAVWATATIGFDAVQLFGWWWLPPA